MPDTLPDVFIAPPFVQALLDGIAAEFRGIRYSASKCKGIFFSHGSIIFGIDICRRFGALFGRRLVRILYLDDDALLIYKVLSPESYLTIEERKFSIDDPNNFTMAIQYIGEILASDYRTALFKRRSD